MSIDPEFRIGYGTDIHRLVGGRRLLIGGIEVGSDLGAEGHSDADVLLHAITDAILGALAEGDIGTHFPNTDEKWRDSSSDVFLERALAIAREKGYAIANLDSVVDLETPRLRPVIQDIRIRLAGLLDIALDCVSVKAKTAEGLGPVGRREAISATAAVILRKV